MTMLQQPLTPTPNTRHFAYARLQTGLSLRCRQAIAERETKNYGREAFNTQLVALADQMHKYVAVNHFYYDAVTALFSESEIADDINEYSHYGLTLITHWLCEQDKALLETLAQITSQVASMADGGLDAS